MRICSYLLFYDIERAEALRHSLNSISGCESTAASEGVTVLVTETDSEAEEHQFQGSLRELSDIGCLVQAFGTVMEASA
jgi:nitrate reductase NapAB chaperone NapD